MPRVLKGKDPYTTDFLNNNAKKFFEESIKGINIIHIDNSHSMVPKVSSVLIAETLVSDSDKTKNVVVS